MRIVYPLDDERATVACRGLRGSGMAHGSFTGLPEIAFWNAISAA